MITDAASQNTPTRSDLHKAAVAYARQGHSVFPLHALDEHGDCTCGGPDVNPKCKPGKHPRTRRGHLDATTDESRITGWWNAYPTANIGAPVPADEVVLDVDRDRYGFGSLEELEKKYGKLPETHTVETGRGGLHLRFKVSADVRIKSRANSFGLMGVDVKANGGYVLLPPSATEGPYKQLDTRMPVELPPAWVKALRDPAKGTSGGSRPATAEFSADLDGPPIHEGERDDTLTRIAGKLHDGTRTVDQLAADLMAINEARCQSPCPERQVEKIARSIHGRPPCKKSARATPEVLKELDALTVAAEGREWDPIRNERRTSIGGHTDRDVYVALLRFARRHGERIPSGVRVSVSVRDLAQEAAVGSTRTVVKALDRLRIEHQLIRRDGTGSGPKSGSLVLLSSPDARGNTHPPTGHLKGADTSSVSPCVPPLSADRLRWSAPGHGGRLGKIRGRIVDVLEATGPLTLAELAGVLRRRPYDLRRRTLPPLLAAGVVECFAGQYRLVEDWRAALDNRRELDGEIFAAERQRQGYELQRVAFAEAWRRGELVSKAELVRRRRNRNRIRPEERHVSGTLEELEMVPDPGPELMGALREFLRRNPHRSRERPSWLSVALWADDYLPTKPPPAEIEAALLELAGVAA